MHYISIIIWNNKTQRKDSNSRFLSSIWPKLIFLDNFVCLLYTVLELYMFYLIKRITNSFKNQSNQNNWLYYSNNQWTYFVTCLPYNEFNTLKKDDLYKLKVKRTLRYSDSSLIYLHLQHTLIHSPPSILTLLLCLGECRTL